MKLIYPLAAVALLAATHVPAQNSLRRPAAPGELPIGYDCIITVDPRGQPYSTPQLDPPPGIRPEYTIFGKLVEVGPDWVVVKEGIYTNWISRERVFSIRANY
jgi:hypothetical protein